MLFCSLGFVFGGVGLLFVGEPIQTLVGWTGILFFGACAAVYTWQLFDSRPRLTISEIGIVDRTLGIGLIPWSDIEGAYKHTIKGSDYICLRLKNVEVYLAKLPKLSRATVSLNAKLGFEPINLNLTGIKGRTDQLLDLILKKSEEVQLKHG
jgi:hypothetical protein